MPRTFWAVGIAGLLWFLVACSPELEPVWPVQSGEYWRLKEVDPFESNRLSVLVLDVSTNLFGDLWVQYQFVGIDRLISRPIDEFLFVYDGPLTNAGEQSQLTFDAEIMQSEVDYLLDL